MAILRREAKGILRYILAHWSVWFESSHSARTVSEAAAPILLRSSGVSISTVRVAPHSCNVDARKPFSPVLYHTRIGGNAAIHARYA